MQKTANYGLNKPEIGEFYNVEEFNENADLIDEKLKEFEDGYLKTTGGTMGGRLQANPTSQALLADAQMRNIAIVASATEGASTSLPDGAIVFSKE